MEITFEEARNAIVLFEKIWNKSTKQLVAPIGFIYEKNGSYWKIRFEIGNGRTQTDSISDFELDPPKSAWDIIQFHWDSIGSGARRCLRSYEKELKALHKGDS